MHQVLKPITEFNKSPNNRDGLRTWCKGCLAEYHQERYSAKREHILALNRKYKDEHADEMREWARVNARKNYQADPERYREASRIYNREHLESVRERARVYSAKLRAEGKVDKEKMREWQRAYRERHKDRIAESHRAHVEANRDKIRMRLSNAKARRRMADGTVTAKQWKSILLFYGNSCALCKVSASEVPMTVDHFIPLIKNGTNTWDNVWPLCMLCNVKKGTKIPDMPIPPHVDMLKATGTFN